MAASCSVLPEGGNDDDVLETVARICGKLASEGGGEAVVVESLRELQGVHMTLEALEATKIGHAVNTLRKSAPWEQARRLAAALYRQWKALADERFKTSRTQQQPSKADEGNNRCSSSPPPPLVDAKQSVRPDGDREIASTSLVVEATSETKLPRRHEVFDSAAIIKKPRSLPVINTKTPGKSEQRRVTVVRRTAAAPEPASARNTRRNGGGPNSNQQANCAAAARNHGTSTAAKRVSPTSAATLTPAWPKPPTALPKPVVGSSGVCKRKAEATTVYDEARLARARIRLHEGYKEAAAVKETRKIKEINVIDALGKKARQRTAHYAR